MGKVKRNKRVSYSQYSFYEHCPYQYKLAYVDKLSKSKENIHLIFGRAMHEVIQSYLDIMYNESIKDADEMPLAGLLYHSMIHQFKAARRKMKSDPATQDEMIEFYHDGIEILKWFTKPRNRIKFYSRKGYKLIGIEVLLNTKLKGNIDFLGYIDVVLQDVRDNSIIIIDLKVSTRGWNSYNKSNKVKTNQILLYKKIYSEKFNVPLEKIKVEYQICRRKLPKYSEFPIPRMSRYVPANGKPSMNKSWNDFMVFVNTVFDDNGNRRTDIPYLKNPSKLCDYCEFDSICDKKN